MSEDKKYNPHALDNMPTIFMFLSTEIAKNIRQTSCDYSQVLYLSNVDQIRWCIKFLEKSESQRSNTLDLEKIAIIYKCLQVFS